MRKLSKTRLGRALCGRARGSRRSPQDGVTATEIVLGSHTALSGPVSAWGIGATEMARACAIDEANEKGIHGRKIRLVVEDHSIPTCRARCRPATS